MTNEEVANRIDELMGIIRGAITEIVEMARQVPPTQEDAGDPEGS